MKAEIRKKIGKEEGDWVHVRLFADNDPVEVPEEFLRCLKEEKDAYEAFMRHSDGEKKAMID